MNSIRSGILCCLVPVLMCSCAGGGEKVAIRSGTQSQAITRLERGIRAQNKGEIILAEKNLTEALAISSSIEDNPARINALVNLARLDRLNHKPESATLYIDQALRLAKHLPDLVAETTYEKALIELSQKRYREALTWATTTLASGAGETKGRCLNLLARIHRAGGDKNEAAAFALQALEENRRNGLADEESNALRLLGSVERENKRFVESGKFLQEALEIDKQIGASQKIALDLEELAALSGDQGDLNIMADYLDRAYSVHLNGARVLQAAATKYKLAEIYRKTGNTALEESALKTADQLIRKESHPEKSSPESASPSRRP